MIEVWYRNISLMCNWNFLFQIYLAWDETCLQWPIILKIEIPNKWSLPHTGFCFTFHLLSLPLIKFGQGNRCWCNENRTNTEQVLSGHLSSSKVFARYDITSITKLVLKTPLRGDVHKAFSQNFRTVTLIFQKTSEGNPTFVALSAESPQPGR